MAAVRGDFDAGIVGTFDVENFGDLLFPLIAAAALRQRDPRIRVHAYSMHAKSTADWPYAVRSVADLADALPQITRLADVDDGAEAILVQVDARLVRDLRELVANVIGDGHRTRVSSLGCKVASHRHRSGGVLQGDGQGSENGRASVSSPRRAARVL